MSAALTILADRIGFGLRREMAKRFGYVEAYGRKGGFCVNFQHEGRRHRISSIPIGNRWIPISTRDLADEILEEIRAEIRRTGDIITSVAPYMARSKLLAMENRYREFCEVKRKSVEAGQLSAKRLSELEGHLSRGKLDLIREQPLQAVNYASLEALQADLFSRGYKPKTVHHVLADVRTFLRWCARREWIKGVPEIPVTLLDEYEPTIPSVEEQRQRIAEIPADARGYFLARGFLGIRHQEALRAEISHYRRGPWDDEHGRWRDELSIKAKGRRFRVLPVPADLAVWVREYRPALAEAGASLFLNPHTRQPWSQSSLIRVWRSMEARLGLPHVKPNEALRHCFGTRTAERLIAEGRSRDEAQAAVMAVMGHVSKATSDRYVKLAAELLRGVIQ